MFFRMKALLSLLIALSIITTLKAQDISGFVTKGHEKIPAEGAQVFLQNTRYITVTDYQGYYILKNVNPGKYVLITFIPGQKSVSKEIQVSNENLKVSFVLEDLEEVLDEVVVNSEKEKTFGIKRLNSVEGTAIYESKKSEVIVMDEVDANLATNNSRQIFAKVAGVNIWESDCAGIQLGVSTRGLNPNRTSEFNTRQNGYDMSADAFGYPEAYYTPPAEAVERIEIVRGAASLQYGTQFGGMINFITKKGPEDKVIELESRNTAGQNGFFNTFNSIGGTKNKFSYYAYYQYKRADQCGCRENSGFGLQSTHFNLGYKVTSKLSLRLEYTLMDYTLQQPGGVTDMEFYKDPYISRRERNWFKLNWNLAALSLDYKISETTKLNIRNFGLLGSRGALGYLGRAGRPDNFAKNRDLMYDNYTNFGNETRLLHDYQILGNTSVLLLGTRFYRGFTYRRQGDANAKKGPDFKFLHPEDLEHSDFTFPVKNFSFFAENIFNITPKLSITPGIRFEHIATVSEGYYKKFLSIYRDPSGNFHPDSSIYSKVQDNKSIIRNFVLFGLGISYRPNADIEWYSSFSQNYRAINFNDLRIFNPNIVVDENLKDENGFNADTGIRGKIGDIINFDASIFYLRYNDRIGSVFIGDTVTLASYRLRKNIADAAITGLETFFELNVTQLILEKESNIDLLFFSNVTFLDARYFSSEKRFRNKELELAPHLQMRYGVTVRTKNFSTSLLYSHTGEQFSDASNAKQTSQAIEGIIPSYYVMDYSISYKFKFLTFSGAINNLTNNKYFTRRAVTYPGPGIIPSDGRLYYLTLAVKI